jgi:hypothetical protein
MQQQSNNHPPSTSTSTSTSTFAQSKTSNNDEIPNNNNNTTPMTSAHVSLINKAITMANSTSRKRKVKFSFKLTLEALKAVPYLNGVFFCKVRLCDGGNHVSYSAK